MNQKKKIFVYSIITIFFSLVIIELFCFIIIAHKEKSSGTRCFPVIDIFRVKNKLHSFAHKSARTDDMCIMDPTLGHRFKKNWMLNSHSEITDEGKERSANSQKNFLYTDEYGYIANISKVNCWRDYRDVAENHKDYFVILVSGGSVTCAGASKNEKTWPAVLERLLNSDENKLRSKYKKFIVINSGVYAYTISQEIKRFQEETIYLNPDLVISINGFLEKTDYYGNPVDYSISDYQYNIINTLSGKTNLNKITVFFPYISKFILSFSKRTGISDNQYGYKSEGYIEENAADLYLSKIVQFKGICDAFSIQFINIFEPMLGLGNKVFSPKEKLIAENYFSDPDFWDVRYKKFSNFHKEIKNKSETTKEFWKYDFINLFDDYSDTMYSDANHYNDEGHLILAEKIFTILLQDHYLNHNL